MDQGWDLCNKSALVSCEMLGKHEIMCYKPSGNIFRHVDKLQLCNARLRYFYVLKRSDSSKLRLVSLVCSLNCFGNDLVCWQLICVNITKRLPGSPF